MGRLIDADAIKWDKCEDASGNPVYILDKRDIDAQPTAYDVDKVIERLEIEKNPIYREDGSLMAERAAIGIDKAIEIVKGGGKNEQRT